MYRVSIWFPISRVGSQRKTVCEPVEKVVQIVVEYTLVEYTLGRVYLFEELNIEEMKSQDEA